MTALVRNARRSDKKQLMSFIKDIWGGHDYIPDVWDKWLEDESGRMFVVELDGVAVGMNRIRFMEDGSAWFEGARVHPGFRGRGLASMLGKMAMSVAKKRGAEVFRLTSGSHNKLAHRQIARVGFKESSRVSLYEAGKRKRFSRERGVRRAGKADLDLAIGLIRGSREFRLGSGVFWDSFAATSLSSPVVEKLLDEGAVWLAPKAVLVTRVAQEGRELWRQVCFAGGKSAEAMKLVRHVFSARGREGARRLVFAPQKSGIIREMRHQGFRRLTGLILFERSANG